MISFQVVILHSKFQRRLPNFASPNPLVDSSLANRILQLAINRDPKSIPSANQINGVLQTPKPTASPSISPVEVEHTKKQLDKELQSYNNDIRLLSSLLGRPITGKDIPSLTRQLAPAAPRTTTTTTTSTTTTTRRPPVDPALLQQLLRKQQQQHNSSPAVIAAPELYGRTNEAILASVLKQRGIGPANTNANIDEILAKISSRGGVGTATVQPIITTTTTVRPRPRTSRPPEFLPLPPQRSSRPILDGLSWLWREWQATAPQPRPRLPGSSLIASPPADSFGLSGGLGGRRPSSQSLAYRDEGLDPDAVSGEWGEF